MTRVVLLCALLICILAWASLAQGEIVLPGRDIVAALLGEDGVPRATSMVVRDVRLPRIILALLAGMALAVAGAITQTLMRNPLAEPGLLGVNAGAALSALVVIVFLRIGSPQLIALASFAGALAAALTIYLLALRGGASPLRVILIGIGLSAFCGGLAQVFTVFGEVAAVQQAQVWLAGTVYLANWEKVAMLALWCLPAIAIATMFSRTLDLTALGEEAAAALGQPVQTARALLLLLCVFLAAGAVAATGLIGFVGLVSPHIARALVGHRHARLLPVSALVGGGLLMGADLVGRTVIAPAQLPAGLVTALIGAPALAYIFWKTRHETS